MDQWNGKYLPYVDNLVNLVVAEDPAPMPEVMRVLCPGGVAYVKAHGAGRLGNGDYAHNVVLTKPFCLDALEVTAGSYQQCAFGGITHNHPLIFPLDQLCIIAEHPG